MKRNKKILEVCPSWPNVCLLPNDKSKIKPNVNIAPALMWRSGQAQCWDWVRSNIKIGHGPGLIFLLGQVQCPDCALWYDWTCPVWSQAQCEDMARFNVFTETASHSLRQPFTHSLSQSFTQPVTQLTQPVTHSLRQPVMGVADMGRWVWGAWAQWWCGGERGRCAWVHWWYL